MILDNENNNLKVHEWISKYTDQGELDIVTGYFTIGALAWLSQNVNEKISNFRLVLGDIVNAGAIDDRPLDLLNENITVEASLKLNSLAKEAVRFLKQDKVVAKTLEPNFCHAKAYLFNPAKNDDRDKYFVTGSSNLTEAGIGLKHTNNVELNIAETGNNNQYKELAGWFNTLWEKPQAHKQKTLVNEKGEKTKVDFKQYLIKEIEQLFIKYTPKDIYFKVLFELFGAQLMEAEDDPNFNRQIGRLENSVIYNTLYDFQKKGVLSLIRMLQKYNGAILADAVGLGKTWSALAVIKYFQLQGREVLLLCPKKLEHNWRRYTEDFDSRFEKDKLKYFIRFHTDMHEDRLDSYNDRADKYFTNDNPKLIVIDESHNLRNDKSNRFQFLLENVIKPNEDIKVLLLSATPINNTLLDIRNQFKLMIQDRPDGYNDSLGIRNLEYTFRSAQRVFNQWQFEQQPLIGDLIKKLPANFFTLTDSLIVARTRKMIEGQQTGLTFPIKTKPNNLFVTPTQLGNFESFEELFENFPPMLSGYQPSFYVESEETGILFNEKQRDRFLVKMMYILMVKRLESSWYSFFSTLKTIRDHHQNALNKIIAYQEGKKELEMDSDEDDIFIEDDIQADIEELTLGKKRQISLSEIDDAGNIDNYKNDLKKDLAALDNLFVNLQKFELEIEKETLIPNNSKSADDKIEQLIKVIKTKRALGENNANPKVIIFTVYSDTAQYLYGQLKARGFNNLAMVTGSGSATSDSEEITKKFEPILERFAPYTKLYKEKEWNFHTDKQGHNAYREWIGWVKDKDPKTYNKVSNPIDVLVATDVLSEGQNLQDADMVINYDIHWNPVRIIQRMGRIDRLGSPNEKIFGVNFWPSNNINTYLNLQGRIEQRMTVMKLAGSEVDSSFSESFKKMSHNENLDQRMKNRMMEQMQITFEDLDGEESFGLDDLSLERFRQDLFEEFSKDKHKYSRMPKGIYTGFKADKNICPQKGIIALLGYPAKTSKSVNHEYKEHDLIYINEQGKLVLLNQKDVLEALTLHRDEERYVPDEIDSGDPGAISKLVEAIDLWMKEQASNVEEQEDGSSKNTMGKEALDILSKLRKGDKKSIERVKENETVEDKYLLNNFDLITWFLVSE